MISFFTAVNIFLHKFLKFVFKSIREDTSAEGDGEEEGREVESGRLRGQ